MNLGQTGRIKLSKSETHMNKYEKGNIDVFKVEMLDVGNILSIDLEHDNAGYGRHRFNFFLHFFTVPKNFTRKLENLKSIASC